jgi:hypothetical protein
MRAKSLGSGFGVGLLLGVLAGPAAAQETAAERAAALKASMAASQVVLRQYEWIETTVVKLKGEEKSQQQNRCYFGAEGGVQKVPIASPPPEERKRGVRGRVVERKKEELTDYMQEAVALVKQYAPPDPVRIQSAKDAGRLTLQPLQPGKVARLTFSGYLKSGDSLSVDLDLTTNRLLASRVSSRLDTTGDPVTLAVQFGTLPDGTVFTSDVVLEAPAKALRVEVQNTGYRRLGG